MLIANRDVIITSRRVFGGQPTISHLPIFIDQRMYRTSVLTVSLLALAACKGSPSSASAAPSRSSAVNTPPESVAGPLHIPRPTPLPQPMPSPNGGRATPNQLGRIPVLEYHVIEGDK